MEFELATIEVIRPPGGKTMKVLFNPTEYRLSKANRFTELAIPGLGTPPIQFGHGNARVLSMQLFFDTYTYTSKDGRAVKRDVRDYTDEILGLLDIDPELHAPPVCRFTWGERLQFQGVLERANQRFTLFLADGTPVRATVDVSFKEFAEDTSERQSANFVKYQVVARGDTLAAIAARSYGDPALWRPIARENDLQDPLSLTPGQSLVIPAIE